MNKGEWYTFLVALSDHDRKTIRDDISKIYRLLIGVNWYPLMSLISSVLKSYYQGPVFDFHNKLETGSVENMDTY